MIEIPSLRPETRYGIPTADQMLFNREYIVGYSYLLRQARFTMEVIDPTNSRVEIDRVDSFRPDLRIPEAFRPDLADYEGSGHHRGHLVASADRRATEVKNSETFLLSNISPQKPGFNLGIWKRLEMQVRELANQYVEVYVICGPLFDIGKKIAVIGRDDKNKVVIPIPHAYFKTVLAESVKGSLHLWSFIFPNHNSRKPLSSFLCTTEEIERRAGLSLWDRLRGKKAETLKTRKSKMW